MKFWDEVDAFKNQLRQSEGKPEYSFYDGPPFATGSPHYGHILAGTIKDVRTRFAHQTGFHVPRNFGWDTHGMPIEFEVDKMLGIKVRSARRRARCRPLPAGAVAALAADAVGRTRAVAGGRAGHGHQGIQRQVPQHRDALRRGVERGRAAHGALDRLRGGLQDHGPHLHGTQPSAAACRRVAPCSAGWRRSSRRSARTAVG